MNKPVQKINIKCACCGTIFQTRPKRIEQNRGKFCSRSCSAKINNIKHGHTNHESCSKTYNTWSNMKARCNNPKNHKYYMYGAKGIKVCKEWDKFENFLKDMGEKPNGKTIDRINGSLGYFKENCRWASIKEQQNNLKNNVIIEYKKEKYTLSNLANKLNINSQTLKYRIKVGWDESKWHTKKEINHVLQSFSFPILE